MFSQLDRGSATQRNYLAISLGLHAAVFAWLLYSPAALLLQPKSVALGRDGRVLSRVYFPSQNPDNSTTNSSDRATRVYRHQHVGHKKLNWKPTEAEAKLSVPQSVIAPPSGADKSETEMLSKLGHGNTAGPRYGSLPGGPIYGDEIRPALPVATSDPVIYPWERPDGEGKVVIEITINEKGEITHETVLQSMGAEIDSKCLAALEKWRFQPATKNGLPIASKQDAIFPFKPRGVSADWRGLNAAPRPAIMSM